VPRFPLKRLPKKKKRFNARRTPFLTRVADLLLWVGVLSYYTLYPLAFSAKCKVPGKLLPGPGSLGGGGMR
jgi:hypothetical protein